MTRASLPPLHAAIAAMPRSGIREVADLAAQRGGVLRLEVGEPNFATPAHIVEAGCRALRDGHTGYTANAGTGELRHAVARKLQRCNGLDVDAEQVVVTSGAVGALLQALMVLAAPGERVLVPDPGWPNYTMMATMIGAEAVAYRLHPAMGYEPELDRLAVLMAEPRVKVLIVNSPSNPTGGVWREATIRRVLELARTHGVYVVSDEVYEDMVFEGEHISPAALDDTGLVVTVSSLSKTYAMTGWRIGYLAAERRIAALVAKVQEAVVACPNAAAQVAACAALDGPQDCVAEMRDAYRGRRDVAVSALREADMFVTEPRGAFYVLADVGAFGDDVAGLARTLVADHGVAVAPGTTFGESAAGLVRISLASETRVIRAGIERIRAARDAAC